MLRAILLFTIFLILDRSLLLSREGYLQCRDGHIYEGHLRFESNTVIVANAAQVLRVQVPLTNVAELVFLRPSLDLFRAPVTGSPDRWENEDIGSVRFAGFTEHVAGGIQVYGSGTNILAGADAFHFVFRRARGPTEIMARVVHVSLTDPWARAGLMMRESLKADARHVFLALSAARGGVLQTRAGTGADTGVRLDPGMKPPYWLRLKRDGNRFSAFKSLTGRSWTLVESVTLPMTEELTVGLAVVGVGQQALNQSVFEGVAQGSRVRDTAFTPELELRSGSRQRGHVAALDDTGFHFEGRPPRDPVSRSTVANIRFQPLPRGAGTLLSSGREGALLHNGQFIDGSCHGVEGDTLILNSIPLGLCRLDLGVEVVAVVLRPRSALARQPFQVVTADGSTWVGLEATFESDAVRLREPALGVRRIPWHDIMEFRRAPL